jgi:hypothetical protein
VHNVTDSLLFQFTLSEILRTVKVMKLQSPSDSLLENPSSSWNFNTTPLRRLHTYFSGLNKESSYLHSIEELIKDHTYSKKENFEGINCLLQEISSHLFDHITLPEENLLFFLLRRREELDDLHGKDFVARTFKRLFPEGDVEEWLSDRFQKRGFTHLIPVIKHHLEGMG